MVIANNLLDAAITARDSATATLSGNYTTASAGVFVNPAAGDLHLKATASVAIDRGALQPDCMTDWDGSTRPAGAATDLGADEFGSAPTPPTNLRIVR